MSPPLPPVPSHRKPHLRPRRRLRHRPTLAILLRLVLVFAVALGLVVALFAWRDRADHEQLGPGRIVVSPH